MCETHGLTWRAYSENLGAVGSTACSFDGTTSTGLYTRKHDPWTYYQNVTHTNERPYSDLAGDIAGGTLPNLVFIVPNNCHNTHNSTTAGCGLTDGDNWLAANMPALLAALGPKGLLVLTWDEDDSSANNHILTALVGPLVIPGAVSDQPVNHYTIVRMICEALNFPTFERATAEASIVNVWKLATPAVAESWGRLKAIYR
jgi:acid phosphatase